ncbi:MAG: preprotein translocase subunit SecE [Elusimicrobia bacterium]|jgi:preprotein translocase subunit SecE|nr:preprotein translocase subunit SecE [Elusimicrobiota bacterium]
MIDKITEFFRGVISEAGKVTWPSRRELIGSTIVVVILVLIVAAYIGLVDFFLSRILSVLLK